jgi:hypothetical protein
MEDKRNAYNILVMKHEGKISLGSRVTSLRRKKFRTTCLGFTPSLPAESKALSGA